MDKENYYKKLAKQRAWTFTGFLPQSESTTTKWICNNGHEVFMSAQEVKKLKDCRICKKKYE